jgi:uncharacterized membrane protein
MLQKRLLTGLPFIICFVFFAAYFLLSLIRHLHFGSYGFDLGIVDQIVWKYSQFKMPITTIQFYFFTSLLTDHVELIYILIAPFYWLYKSPITLLFLQAFLIAFSGLPVYYLARKKKITLSLSIALLIAYLCFYGIQNAIWFDVHSITFAAAFLPWFLYFLDSAHMKRAWLAFILAIICKEDVALLTLLISAVYFLTTGKKYALLLSAVSLLYLVSIFAVYFPYFTQDGYRYDNAGGLLADGNPTYFFDTQEKREVYIYSLGWFSFLPLLSPVLLLPALGDVARYFVLGNSIDGAQGLFMHYRASLALLMVWPFIETIRRFTKLNTVFVAIYLVCLVSFLQYRLHVPLTYLTKSWFWTEPESVPHIRSVLAQIPENASVVAQNNIVPHVAQRDEIFTLWPEKRTFTDASVCSSATCDWLKWGGRPQFLLVDTSADWDARHLLVNREEFVKGITNLEKQQYIKKKFQKGNAVLYTIEKQPDK